MNTGTQTTPMQLSERIGRISVSSTAAVMMEADRLRASGIDLVDFGAGEPDFQTPAHIRAAAARAIEAGFTKYTFNYPTHSAVAAWQVSPRGKFVFRTRVAHTGLGPCARRQRVSTNVDAKLGAVCRRRSVLA